MREASETPRLRDRYEALLLDLDGTLYRGSAVVEGGPAELAGGSQRLMYVTNNASRAAGAVADHLAELGYSAGETDVVTSAQAAVRLLAERVERGAEVLVVGTDDLAAEVKAAGLQPVRRATDSVAAVVQGHSPQTAWPDLAEASYALRAGAIWVAANTDRTLPNERGLAPGNGAMVAALRAASDREPVVAGKPCAPLLDDALARAGTRAALVVGDRLDTDIDGAENVAVDSLLVLTGVSTVEELAGLPEERWPTYIAGSLAALNNAPVVGGIGEPAAIRRELLAHPDRALRVRAPRSEIR
ncbi:HAD-IIA family hydrolase [Nocardia sp. NPDC019395]|uniref:HAD-IIA family hydrolase n=1 Tax=Nocardia sp. NPDC019395 TaxID=3154686 RepID=UPI0033D01504